MIYLEPDTPEREVNEDMLYIRVYCIIGHRLQHTLTEKIFQIVYSTDKSSLAHTSLYSNYPRKARGSRKNC